MMNQDEKDYVNWMNSLLRPRGNLTEGSEELSRLKEENVNLRAIVQSLVESAGRAHCYDRYCRDDEWTYCIFCGAGDFDPGKQPGWEHTSDCLITKARALVDVTQDDK